MSWLRQPDYTDFEGSQTPVETPPAFLDGIISETPRSLGKALLRVGETSALITGGVLQTIGDDEGAEDYWKKLEQRKKWREDLGENRQGLASQVLGGVVEYGSLAITNAPAAAVSVFSSEATSEVHQGRNSVDASALGAIRAGALYAGAKIPASLAPKYGLGKTLGYGVIANTGIGTAARGAEQLMGEDVQAFDPTALAIDAILGGAFSAVEFRANKKLIDSALDKRSVTKAQDSAPFIPKNGAELDIHMQAVADTIKSSETGIEPDLSRVPRGEDVDPRVATRINETIAEFTAVAKDEIDAFSAPKKQPSKSEQYAAIKETEGGRIIDADIARNLDPDYVAGRKQAKDVHEMASRTADEVYSRRLAEPDPTKEKIVHMTAGGAGAGKSTALRAAGIDTSEANIVYDATLKTFDNAINKIREALEADHDVKIDYIMASPARAWESALIRAEKTGRVVPSDVFLATHTGSLATVKKLIDLFDGSKRVSVRVLDNTKTLSEVKPVNSAELSKVVYNDTVETLNRVAKKLKDDGRISDQTYSRASEQTSIAAAPREVQEVRGPDDKGDGGRPEEIRATIDENGNEFTGVEAKAAFEAEEKTLTDTLGKITNVAECILRNFSG